MSSIEELKFDDKNFNKHTAYGMGLLEKSLSEFGAGRSVLVDKNNKIIAGNGIVESAINVGIDKTKVIETTGDELVVVKRTDIDLDTKRGRRMALADNATASADLEWNEENLSSELSPEDMGDWGVELLGVDIDTTVETASFGTVTEFNEDTRYDLKRLYRERINPELAKEVEEGVEKGLIRAELAEVMRTRVNQCAVFNFDEIIKFYRSGDASETEKELLKKLYLVFITPKEAFEAGILQIERTTGEIYSRNLTRGASDEN